MTSMRHLKHIKIWSIIVLPGIAIKRMLLINTMRMIVVNILGIMQIYFSLVK